MVVSFGRIGRHIWPYQQILFWDILFGQSFVEIFGLNLKRQGHKIICGDNRLQSKYAVFLCLTPPPLCQAYRVQKIMMHQILEL